MCGSMHEMDQPAELVCMQCSLVPGVRSVRQLLGMMQHLCVMRSSLEAPQAHDSTHAFRV